MSANRKYKNSVFTSLFTDEDKLLNLYNAVSGSDLPADTPIRIATLDGVLFNERRNDLAFVIGAYIVFLLEHQASINENMPLKLLIYIARVYEAIIESTAIHRRKLFKIPEPRFIVLYNGTDPFPARKQLRLSDAYNELPADTSEIMGKLELTVEIININSGYNEEIVKRSKELSGYVYFVGEIHTQQPKRGNGTNDSNRQSGEQMHRERNLVGVFQEAWSGGDQHADNRMEH